MTRRGADPGEAQKRIALAEWAAWNLASLRLREVADTAPPDVARELLRLAVEFEQVSLTTPRTTDPVLESGS